MLVGRQIIQLLYTDNTMNEVTGVAKTFTDAFRHKLARSLDHEDILMEWAIAAILDPRQKLLGKFRHVFEGNVAVRWLT